MSLGSKIKSRRIEIGLSVDEIAEKLHKNRATIYRYESNEIENLPLSVLEPLSTILNVTPAYLMGWDDNEKTASAIDALKTMLKDIYDDVIIKEDLVSGSYSITLSKNNLKLTLDEIPFETLFKTVCSIIPKCVDIIAENVLKGEYETMPYTDCLSTDEIPMLEMYRRLNPYDRAEIRGEMKQMLKSKKYINTQSIDVTEKERRMDTDYISLAAYGGKGTETKQIPETKREEVDKILKKMKTRKQLD